MLLIRDDLPQYKANLHCHSTYSDGKLTPLELKEAYRSRGYDILAITDHEHPRDHSALGEPDFLLLTGYESYVRPSPRAEYDLYAPEVHLNFFARDPHNVALVRFSEPFTKYRREDSDPFLCPRVGTDTPRVYTVEYVNGLIREANENGYLVSYNHPVWSMEDPERLLAYEGLFAMEIFNGGSYLLNGMEYNGALYDTLLCRGKRLAVLATDDNHNGYPFGHAACDSFRGFTMIQAPRLDYASVISALERGDFYASRGPRITRLEVKDRRVTVECSPASHIYVYTGSKSPKHLHTVHGDAVTHAAFEVDGRAKYIRVSVVDAEGNTADTRAYFPDELGW